MRTCERVVCVVVTVAVSAAGSIAFQAARAQPDNSPALAFDGSRAPPNAPRSDPVRIRSAQARAAPRGRDRKRRTGAGIRRRAGPAAAQWKLGRMYAEGDGVERNDLRAFEYFSRIAEQPRRRQSGKPAGALRRQRLRRARPLLPRRHPEFSREGRSRPRAARCSPMRRPTSAIPTRSTIWRASISTEGARPAIRARRPAGSISPPTRASTRPRRCSAACCSRASTCRARRRAA